MDSLTSNCLKGATEYEAETLYNLVQFAQSPSDLCRSGVSGEVSHP